MTDPSAAPEPPLLFVKVRDAFPDRTTPGVDSFRATCPVCAEPGALHVQNSAGRAVPWCPQATCTAARLHAALVARLAPPGAPGLDVPGGLVLRCLATIEPRVVEWLWRPYVPAGKLTILFGAPGLGKSFLCADLAARITSGRAMPDGSPGLGEPRAVVILSAEDDAGDTLRPRLDAQGGDPALVYVVEGIRGERGAAPDWFSLDRDLAALERVVVAHQAAFVHIDPLSAYLGRDGDSHKDSDMRRLLGPLAALAERTQAAILGVMHPNKAGTQAAVHRPGGSVAFVAAARCVLVVGTPDPERPEARVLAPVKSNVGPLPPPLGFEIGGDPPRVTWTGPADGVTADDVLAAPDPQAREARSAARALLEEMLPEGGTVPAKEILTAARDAGLVERTVQRTADKLGVVKRRVGFGPGSAVIWTRPLRRHPAPIDGTFPTVENVSLMGGSVTYGPADPSSDGPAPWDEA